jgi:hypothetical protein
VVLARVRQVDRVGWDAIIAFEAVMDREGECGRQRAKPSRPVQWRKMKEPTVKKATKVEAQRFLLLIGGLGTDVGFYQLRREGAQRLGVKTKIEWAREGRALRKGASAIELMTVPHPLYHFDDTIAERK